MESERPLAGARWLAGVSGSESGWLSEASAAHTGDPLAPGAGVMQRLPGAGAAMAELLPQMCMGTGAIPRTRGPGPLGPIRIPAISAQARVEATIIP